MVRRTKKASGWLGEEEEKLNGGILFKNKPYLMFCFEDLNFII
jgi:hypothetical protein